MWNPFKKKIECSEGRFVCLKHPYLGHITSKNAGKMLNALREGKDLGSTCFIIMSPGGKNQLDLIRSDVLLQPYYRNQEIIVVGLAVDEEDAKLVLLRMLQSCYNSRHDADLRSYLHEQIRREGWQT